MERKIAELTQRLYQEGIEKGEARARELIAEAEAAGTRIVADAEDRARAIAEQAARHAEETRRHVDAEIRLSAAQALTSFKQLLLTSVIAQVVDDAVTRSLSDTATVTEFIKSSVRGWNCAAGQAPDLVYLLPEAQKAELDQSVRKAVSQVLTGGVELRYSTALKAGFRVGPKDGAFAVSFTDEDFREFFKEYARPRAKKYLFGE